MTATGALVADALGGTLLPDELRGDPAHGRRLAAAALERAHAAGDRRAVAETRHALAATDLVAGRAAAAEAALTSLAADPDADPLVRFRSGYLGWVATRLRFDVFPGWRGVSAVEVDRRWKAVTAHLAEQERLQTSLGMLPPELAADVGETAELAAIHQGWLGTFSLRAAFHPAGAPGPHVAEEKQAREALAMLERYCDFARPVRPGLALTLERLAAHVVGDLGDRAAASARLADARERARSQGDDVGAARLELAGLDLRLAAFSSPDVLDLAVREGTDADSHLGFHVERAELDWTTPLPDGAEMDTELARLAKRAEALGAPRLAAAVQLRRAYVALRQREPEAAIRFATDAELAFAETGDEASAHLATVHAAAAALWSGRQGDEGVVAAIGVWGRDGGSFSWALGLGILLTRVGRLLERQGLPEAALVAHRHAGVLHEALGADLNAARSLVDRSSVLDALGQYGEAASLLEAAARRVERLTAEEGASGLVRAAGALVVARTFNLAISTRNVAALERITDLARHVAGRVRTLGVLDYVAGFDDDRTVQEAARLAAMVADHLDSEAAMAAVLAPLYRGMAARERGDHAGANAYFDAALAGTDTVPGRRRDFNRALVLGTAGRDDEAADAYARFVARAGEEGLAGPDPASTAVLRHEQAVLTHGQALRFFVTVGHPELAEPHLAELRCLAGDRFWEQEDEPWSALGHLAALHLAQRRLTEAADAIGLALAQFDRRRGGLQRDELRRSVVGESGAQGLHLTAAQVELALAAVVEEAGDQAAAGHHRDRSLELAERAKARALYDIVSRGASARPPDDPGDGDVLGEWRSANARVHLWRSRLATLADRPDGDADAGPVEALVAEAERDLAAAVARLGGVDGRLAEVVDPHAEPPSTAEMTAVLPPGTVLLSYFATRGELLLWAADRSGVREIRRHTDHERLLPGLVHVFLEGCRRPGPDPVGGAELSRILLEPLRGPIGSAEQLVVAPVGTLYELPFHALPWDGDVLGADRAVGVVPGASLLPCLDPLAGPLEGRQGLVVGVPDAAAWRSPDGRRVDYPPLAMADDEAELVAGLVGGATTLVGPDATVAGVRAGLRGARFAHLAAHGHLEADSPMLSAVLLSDGGLALHELLGLRLAADLVVLSSCDTGRGRTAEGDDLQGLTRGLVAAGADVVVAGLWEVSDWAALVLMARFYEALGAGADALDALSQARQQLRALDVAALEVEVADRVGRAPERLAHRTRGRRSRLVGDGRLDHPWWWAPYAGYGLPGARRASGSTG